MSAVAPLLSAAMLTGGVLMAGALAPATRTHTVRMAQMQFQPASLAVRQGDTIEWLNDDPVPHTATSARHGVDSGPIAAGGHWRWTARTRGTVTYVCTLHPTMSGRVQVK